MTNYKTNHTIGADMRARISIFLPKALENAMALYKHISIKKPDDIRGEDGKRILDSVMHKKHQEACKVALAHIELLVKLAERVDLPEAVENAGISQDALAAMLENANSEIAEN